MKLEVLIQVIQEKNKWHRLNYLDNYLNVPVQSGGGGPAVDVSQASGA